jgi:uncharacterized protein (TIRG00374 family)
MSWDVGQGWKHILRFLLGVAILVVLLKVFRVSQWQRIFHFHWVYMIGAGVASLGGNIVGTLRWKHTLRAVGVEEGLGFANLLKLYMSGTVLGFAFVGGSGSLAYQALALKKQWNVPYTKVAFSLTLDRMLDPFLTLLLFVPALFYLSEQITIKYFSMAIWLLFGTLIAISIIGRNHLRGLFSYGLRFVAQMDRLARWVKSFFQSSNNPFPVNQSIRVDLNSYPFSPSYLAGLTLGRMILLVLRLQLLAYALGAIIPIEIILIGLLVLQLSWLLAITPGGIGIAEWGWVGVLVRYGFRASDAALLSVAFRLYLIVFSLLALLIALLLCFYQNRQIQQKTVEI